MPSLRRTRPPATDPAKKARSRRAPADQGAHPPSVESVGLSAFIRRDLDAIVAEWETFARTLAPAGHMTALALRDHCREILLSVAADMETHETKAERVAKSKGLSDGLDPDDTAASSHGALRQLSGFDLVQLFAEFRALRASVLSMWQRAATPGPQARALEDSMRFNEAIDTAIADSVKSYSSNVDASRDMFLAVLGHDLRGPLSGIAMASSVLAKTDLSEAARQQAAIRIKRASVEMGQLITDLLEYTRSRLGAGIPIEGAACDLGPICEEAIESIRTSHPEQKFQAELSGNLSLHGDATRLQQVLSNLLNNAVQHGDPAALVSLLAQGRDAEIVLKVRNAGKPIPAKALPHIFQPLVQGAPDSRAEAGSRSKTSLGLGLYIVREIVTGHRGTIEVTSSAKNGTEFTIRLPRHGAGGPSPRGAAPVLPGGAP
jgi:signal transduction histidine kinase